MKFSKHIKYLVMISVISFSLQAFAQQTDLSGTWNRNNTKSDAGGSSFNNIPRTLEIRQNRISISIKRTAINGAAITSEYTEVIKIGGDSSETVTPSKLIRKSSAKWENSQTLEVSSVSKDEKGMVQQKARQTFSLADNGKTLSIDVLQTYGDKEIHLMEIFDKQ